MLAKLTRDDLYVLAVFTAWMAAFVLLVALVRDSGTGYAAVNYIFTAGERGEWAFTTGLFLLFLSVMVGLGVTNPAKGGRYEIAAFLLAALNMGWLSVMYAHFMLRVLDFSPTSILLLMVAPFYVIWAAHQAEGATMWALRFAPTVGAYLLIEDPDLAIAGAATVGILSLIYALSVARVEAAQVNRRRRALGLILFVQSVAILAVLARMLDKTNAADNASRDAGHAAALVAASGLAEFVRRMSFGLPGLPLIYSGLLWLVTFGLFAAIGFELNWGTAFLVAFWTLVLFGSVRTRPVSWTGVAYILLMQFGINAVFAAVLLGNLYLGNA